MENPWLKLTSISLRSLRSSNCWRAVSQSTPTFTSRQTISSTTKRRVATPKAVFSPDVYVVHGVPKKQRDCFFVWKEGGRVPSAVFEFTSKSTRREDAGDKKTKCAGIGVSEYFMVDPKHEYLTPSLQGFRLENGFYKLIAADAQGRLECRTLKLKLCLDEHGVLRVCDAKTGAILPRTEARIADAESNAKHEIRMRRAAEALARREAQARENAEAEIARLREELKRFKNG